MDGDISLLAIYDKIASVDTKVETLTARVDEQLAHSQASIVDHEARLRDLKDKIPDGLKADIAALKASAQQRRGVSSVLQALLIFFGSSTTAAVVAWLLMLTRGH